MTNRLTNEEKWNFKYGLEQHPWIKQKYDEKILDAPNLQLIQELLNREDIEGSFIQILENINKRIQKGVKD